jgi:hypothetical protein
LKVGGAMHFEKLVETLKQKGYEVEVKKYEIYDFAKVSGKNIIGGFCSPHDENSMVSSSTYINGKIAVDHVDCFDKWRKCPLILPIPTDDTQMDYLLNQLKYWGSEQGYKASNEYEFEKWINDYSDI